MSQCRTQRLCLLQITVAYLALLHVADAYTYLDLPRCRDVKGGAMNAVDGKNSSCVYYQCKMTEAVVDIPTDLLEGYKNYSNIVLVTSYGCSVREHKKISEKGFNFVRLIVPYNGCKTAVQKVGRKIHYHNNPYISYIGEKWLLYFVNTSCTVKSKLLLPKIDWKSLPKWQGKKTECFSSSLFFTIPAAGDLTVTVTFLANDKESMMMTREIKVPIVEFNQDGKSRIVKANISSKVWKYNLLSYSKFRIEDFPLGKIGNHKAFGIWLKAEERPVSVAFTGKSGSASASILPNCALGYEHVVVSYPSQKSYVIIAAGYSFAWNQKTKVQVFDNVGNSVLNTSLTVLQTTYLRDVRNGYIIFSDRPIAVFTVMLDAKVSANNSTTSNLVSDHMAEQLLPVSLWGSKYVVHPSYFGNDEPQSGSLLRLLSYKRTVTLQYLGISESKFPDTIPPMSHIDLDIPVDASFVVKSRDGTNFMAVMIGKSGTLKESGRRPYMIILQSTESFTPFIHSYSEMETQINIVAETSSKSEISINNISTKVPEYYWTDITCPMTPNTCKQSNYTYYQLESLPGTSPVIFTTGEVFGATLFSQNSGNIKGTTAHSGPSKFVHQQVQDDKCGVDWTFFPGTKQCVKIVKNNLSVWDQAAEICNQIDGMNSSLITIKTLEKEIFVVKLAGLMRLYNFHIGFRGLDAKWITGGKVLSQGKPITPATNLANSCGYLTLQYSTNLIKGYKLSLGRCYNNLPFICQKDVPVTVAKTMKAAETTTAFVTTAMATTAIPTLCQMNPCLNAGNCTAVENKEKCTCTMHYTGPYCGEYLLPQNGVYEVTVDKNIPLNLLKKQHRYKRGGRNENQKLFEITRFGNMHAFRIISGCPSSPLCYGWLTNDDFGQVAIADSRSGTHLLHMIPKDDGYVLAFKLPKTIINYRQGIGFYLGQDGSSAVVFRLQKMKSADKIFTPPPFKISMVRYSLHEPVLSKPEQYIAISLDRSSCIPNTDEVTICAWFRSFLGPNSTSIMPMILYNITKSQIGTEFENLRKYKTAEITVNQLTTSAVKIEILDVDEKVIAESSSFITPVVGVRHQFCLLGDKITIDGMSYSLNFHQPQKKFFNPATSTFLSTGPFIGQIDGLDVWCGKKMNGFLFGESTIFPECGGSRGDLASMQSNDVIMTKDVIKTTIETFELACQFCPAKWVLHHSQCYQLINDKKASPIGQKFVNANGGVCPASNSNSASWPVTIFLSTTHNFLSRYVDAVLNQNTDVAWIGMHLNRWKTWKWSQDDSTVSLSYWGEGEPKLGKGNCAVYEASPKPDIQWTPIPTQTDITVGASSPFNYQWATRPCNEQHPFICQKSSTQLFTGKKFMLRIFIIGGSFVSHLSTPIQLKDFRKTLVAMMNKLTSATNGEISYQLIRIQMIPSLVVRTGSRTILEKSILSWVPFPGETNLDNIIKYINSFSNDAKYRYINIITSAYDQHISTALVKKSTSFTFALGLMSAQSNHLKTLSSHASCYDFAKNNDRQRIAVADKLLSCIRGDFIVDEMPYVIAGKSLVRMFDFVEGRSAQSNLLTTDAVLRTTSASSLSTDTSTTTRFSGVTSETSSTLPNTTIVSFSTDLSAVTSSSGVTRVKNMTSEPIITATTPNPLSIWTSQYPINITTISVPESNTTSSLNKTNYYSTLQSVATFSDIPITTPFFTTENSTVLSSSEFISSTTNVTLPGNVSDGLHLWKTTTFSLNTLPTISSTTAQLMTTIRTSAYENSSYGMVTTTSSISTEELTTVSVSVSTSTSEISTAVVAVQTSSEDCPSGYTGEGCMERTEPKNGVVEATSSDDLFGLFPSVSNRRKRSTISSIPLQLVGIKGKYAIRSLYSCPNGAFCLWWLNIINDKVMFVSPHKGYKLWNLVPLPAANKYLVKSPVDGKFIYKSGAKFGLTTNTTTATIFGFKNIPGSSVDTVPEKMVKTFRAEFFKSQSNEAYLDIPLSSSSNCTNTTICFSFQARNSSTLSHPLFRLNWSISSVVLPQISSLPKQQWHDACILIESKKITILIDSFPTPVHKRDIAFCMNSLHLMYNTNETFLGQVKRVNVWSRKLSTAEMHHVHSATCESHMGDVISSVQTLNGTGFASLEDSIPISMCRYCKFDWTLSSDSCYHVTSGIESIGLQYLIEDQCKKKIDPASYGPIVDNDRAHSVISNLVKTQASALEWSKWPLIPFTYKGPGNGYQWLMFGSSRPYNSKNTYWRTNLTFPSATAQCVVYAPTNVSELKIWLPSSTIKVLWDSVHCFLLKPFVCEMSADCIDPKKSIKVVIVMPSSGPLTVPVQENFRLLLAYMLDLISLKSANFTFVESNNTVEVGPKPAPREFLRSWKQTTTNSSVNQTLKEVMTSKNKDANYFVVVVQPGIDLTDVSTLMTNKSVFLLGLENTSLPNLQKLSSKPEYAAVIPEKFDTTSKNNLLSAFHRFLQGLSLPTVVLPSNTVTTPPVRSPVTIDATTLPAVKKDTSTALVVTQNATAAPVVTINPTSAVIYNNTECSKSPCKNNGTCSAVQKYDFSCDCPSTHVGKSCEFESPKITCGDSGLTVLVSIDIIRSLSGTSNNTTPSGVIVYFANQQKISTCSITKPTTDNQNNTMYKLFVPSPFSACGLSIARPYNSTNVTISGKVYYERITTINFIDTSVLIANLSCTYVVKYGIGLRPDDILSAVFQPAPNNLFSAEIDETGNIIVLLKLFLDAKHTKQLPSNPKLKIGTNLYVLLYSKYPLPNKMSLDIETCYLSAYKDSKVKINIVELFKQNCAVPNDISKNMTSVKKDAISFMFQIFKWKGSNKQMHLHCTTKICDMSVGTKCVTNCTKVLSRRKRQLEIENDNAFTTKYISSAPIRTLARDEDSTAEETDSSTLIESKYLVTKKEVYPYLLAGLIMFSFLFFSFVIVIILHCQRMPNPETYAQYTKRSYRRGGSISGPLPRTWTVVHALSPPPSAEVTEPKRTRTYAISSDTNNRVAEIASPNSSQARFSTFLGESQGDDEVQSSVIVVPDRPTQVTTTPV
ncbi:uncharacterized protein LOC120339071 [Styela clava]